MDTAVSLVKAYLELCGYFVLAELPVRTPDGGGHRDLTDLDVVAVRFAHGASAVPRRLARPLEVFLGTDPALGGADDGVDVVVGEVKEGQARLNPALRRAETVAFALRRLGCCPEDRLEEEARRVVERGHLRLWMPGQVPCHVRLVAFGGRGVAVEHGVLTVPLAHCTDFIVERLHEGHDVLGGVQFKEPVLGLLALQAKLSGDANRSRPAGNVGGHDGY